METLVTLSGYIFSAVTGILTWLAGTRSRRNSVYQDLLNTIKTLTQQNHEILDNYVKIQDEVMALRNENAELKSGQASMLSKIEELKTENAELKLLLTNKK